MGWIESYVEYAGNNEACAEFHWWTGMAVLSAVLRRNVEYKRGYFEVFPSLWILLVGESGTGKTTSINIGVNILSKIDSVRILPDRGSAEALAKELSEPDENGNTDAIGVIAATELANFMDRREHNQGLVPMLLSLADFLKKWKKRTINGGMFTLNNVAVTFMGASTSELITDCIPPIALKTGFLARFLIVTAVSERKIVPEPWVDVELEQYVTNELYDISLLNGQMIMPAKVQEWFIAWYFRHKAKSTSEGSERMKAYLERKSTYLLRLGMLLAISKHKRLMYTIEELEEAAIKLDQIEANFEKVYDEIESTTLGKEQRKILSQIYYKKEGISYSELLRKNSLTISDPLSFKKIMTMLLDSKQIVMLRKNGEIFFKRGI